MVGAAARAMILLLGIVASLATAAAGHAAANLRSGDTLLREVNIVDTETGRTERGRTIVIRNGVIVAITGRLAAQAGTAVIEGGGAFAIPGLWDAHVHLMQENEQASRDYAARLIGYGITHVRDMGAIPDVRAAALARFRSGGADAPYVYSAGPTLWTFDPPYGDRRQRVIVGKPADIDGIVARLADGGSDFLKVYAGFDRPALTALAAAAARRRLPLAGHAQPGMTLEEQVRIGMRTIEHVDFATFAECVAGSETYFDRVIASRFAGSPETIPAIYADFAAKADTEGCRAAMRSAAAAGLVFTPTMAVGFIDRATADAAEKQLPPQFRESCDLYKRQFDGLSQQQQALLSTAGRRLFSIMIDAQVPMLAGSDAPTFCVAPGAALAIELSLLTRLGMKPLEVLRSATRNPSRAFGVKTATGRLAVGERANILLLGKNPLLDAEAYASPIGLYTQERWRDAKELASLRER